LPRVDSGSEGKRQEWCGSLRNGVLLAKMKGRGMDWFLGKLVGRYIRKCNAENFEMAVNKNRDDELL